MRNARVRRTPAAKRLRRASPLLLIILVSVASTDCSRNSGTESLNSSAKIEPSPDPNVVVVAHPELFPLVKVTAREEPDVLQVNGAVAPDVSRTVHINSLAGGRVIEIRTKLGDDVQKGQVVLVIHSPDLAQAISDYQKAQADEVLARQTLNRTQELYSHGALAQKDIEQAQDSDQKAKVDVQTAADHIRILGGDMNHLSPIIEVKTPLAGTVVEQNTSGGEAVKSLDNSPSLFTIADLSRVWVLCDVYENDLSQVKVGDTAQVTLNAYPDKSVTGTVNNISRILDPETRTAKVRIELDNRSGLMRPGMFATVRLASRTRHEHLWVPSAAILRLHDRDWVFLPLGDQRFRRTEVHTGQTDADGLQEILGGLELGQQVVANALQFSNSVEP